MVWVMSTPRFESDVYDGLRLRYFLHPQICLLSALLPATISCVPPRKKLKITVAVCDALADADL